MDIRYSITARVACLTLVTVLGASASGWADINRTPIAVPLIGTQQTAHPYPSRITVSPRGGPSQTGQVSVVLYGVTHPCPGDLSVVLVHDDERFLILNNVGGCRPMQGTTLEIVGDFVIPGIPPFPNPNDPPFPEFMRVSASFSGAQPTMPAPFPSGSLISGFPTNLARVGGDWDLYVIDKVAANRGVIAGGWSINYDTSLRSRVDRLTLLPGGGFTSGPAAVYPIAFDLSAARADLRVSKVTAHVDFSHQKPDDLVMVLQSPSGTAVTLLANAGGAINVPGVAIDFDDAAIARPPNNGPIPAGSVTYLPTEWPEATPTTLPAPGPQPPYRPSLNAFINEPAQGIWTLWIYDDSLNGTGLLASASITVRTETLPDVEVTSPALTSTSTQPFVRLEGRLPGASPRDGQMMWRVTNNGAFVDAGPATIDPQTGVFSAEAPVSRGQNRITLRGSNTGFITGPAAVDVTVNEFVYSLAEGATGSFFDLDVTLANATGQAAPIRLELLPEGAAPITQLTTAPALSPLSLSIDTLAPNTAVSTVVHSTNAVPLAVERTMSWDATGYGGHGGGATSPATRWFFAEGSQGFFNTFVLLTNDNAAPVDVTVRFLLEGGGVVTRVLSVAPRARRTLFAGDVADVRNTSFGLDITAPTPIIAERAMYFSMNTDRLFDGGHESAGANRTSTRWFLAEGATGAFFDCFILLSNPNPTPANVTLTYLLPDGRTVPQTVQLAGNSRRTINVETVDPRLANAAVSTIVTADVGIVVERSMFWPNVGEGWREAHNSFGVTDAALRWAVADCRRGGLRDYVTFILLANPNAAPAEVEVVFMKGGATATRRYTLAPTSRLNVEPGEAVPELGDGVLSAVITAVNHQPIVVEKAMYWNAGGVVWAAGTNVTATRMPPP